MCAGISFHIDNIDPHELDHFFTPEEYQKQRKGDLIETFYWQKKPFLPVEEDGVVHLYEWGNRDVGVKMPKTGWAKIESIQDGLWDWLSPKKVIIPISFGHEKRKWFKTPRGLTGIKVRFHNLTRVYLITAKADLTFISKIGHDRMPALAKIVYIN